MRGMEKDKDKKKLNNIVEDMVWKTKYRYSASSIERKHYSNCNKSGHNVSRLDQNKVNLVGRLNACNCYDVQAQQGNKRRTLDH
jgi:hypothetical protein